jgi:hypothetical protein
MGSNCQSFWRSKSWLTTTNDIRNTEITVTTEGEHQEYVTKYGRTIKKPQKYREFISKQISQASWSFQNWRIMQNLSSDARSSATYDVLCYLSIWLDTIIHALYFVKLGNASKMSNGCSDLVLCPSLSIYSFWKMMCLAVFVLFFEIFVDKYDYSDSNSSKNTLIAEMNAIVL